jgi:ABC-type uncharacterized transport system permease subunit
MSATLLHVSTGFLYALSGAMAVRAVGGDRARLAWLGWALPALLLLHAVALYVGTFAPRHLNLSFANAASLVAWLTLAIYWLAGHFDRRLVTLQVLMLPVAACASVLPLIATGTHALPYSSAPLFIAHFAASMLGYSLAVVALVHACLMLLVERQLRRADLPGWVSLLPPLLEMERVLFRVLLASFLLLSVVVVTGVFFSEAMFGRPFRVTHKTVFGILSWLIFGGLVATRRLYGLRGRVAVRWVIAGFVFLMLGYFGYKFVLEIVLQRPASV